MLTQDRIFAEANRVTSTTEWFFRSREGTMGPYPSYENAEQALHLFVECCRADGMTGGRESLRERQLALLQEHRRTLRLFNGRRRDDRSGRSLKDGAYGSAE